ncbi:MAG: hypothetical protein ACI8R0_003029, partial [Alteromonadales bacterium]
MYQQDGNALALAEKKKFIFINETYKRHIFY